jgi:hypothetical protein
MVVRVLSQIMEINKNNKIIGGEEFGYFFGEKTKFVCSPIKIFCRWRKVQLLPVKKKPLNLLFPLLEVSAS